MGNSSDVAYSMGEQIGQQLGGAFIAIIIIAVLTIAIGLALIVWFVYTLSKIKASCTKTNKLLTDISKNISRIAISNNAANADELARYKSLYDSGAITEEDYNLKKIQLLNK